MSDDAPPSEPEFVVITASNPSQAAMYRQLVQARVDAGLYPARVAFRFYSDPPGGRVGSGGGTLLALLALLRDEDGGSTAPLAQRAASFFAAHRVLLLHAGGESRRLPCYVPEGKLFAPLALPSSSSLAPVVLDALLTVYFGYPWRRGEVILASGDVIVDFDPKALVRNGPFERGDLCGFGKATGVKQGARHGVFGFEPGAAAAAGGALAVADFFQKAPEATLRAAALLPALDGSGDEELVAVDTGLFSMSGAFVGALFAWADATDAGGGGASVLAATEGAELYFDYYLEVATAALPAQSEAAYVARMAAAGSKLGPPLLSALHASLSSFGMRAALLHPARFLHFGSLFEFPLAVRAAVDARLTPFYQTGGGGGEAPTPAAAAALALNSVRVRVGGRALAGVGGADADGGGGGEGEAPPPSLVEMCEGSEVAMSAGGFHMCVGLRGARAGGWALPPGVCLDGRELAISGGGGAAQRSLLVYGADDSFKRSPSLAAVRFCGAAMVDWLRERGLAPADVWSAAELEDEAAGKGIELWHAALFPVEDGEGGEVSDGLVALAAGFWSAEAAAAPGWAERWKGAARVSFAQANARSSALGRDARRREIRAEVANFR